MTVDKLRQYIDNFRNWLDNHAAKALQASHSSLIRNWRDELSSAERLLESKPELPIALLGPSQQGKSSLINAILGENILAVGAAIGACTCVVTSLHYRKRSDYRAEIHFISLKDWKSELSAMLEAIRSPPSDDDTEIDREEWESTQEAAREKLNAVYRQDVTSDLERRLNDRQLGLPGEVAEAMSTGQPIVIEEATTQTLRNKVRRFLVGREQHEDGQFWPLISRVSIFGDFTVLSKGVSLVDLPGLNDPNPAREQVTKTFLQESRYIWLVCNSQTGIDRVFTQLLRENGLFFRLFIEGRLGAFSVVATRFDEINLESVLEQMGIDVEDFNGDSRGPLEFRRQKVASSVQKHLQAIAEDIVARAEAGEYREEFLQRVRSIPVFSVGTAAYLHGIGKMPLYQGMPLTKEATHIPKLIEHLHSITLDENYQTQVEASWRRLEILHEQVRRFFFDLIQRIEQGSSEARREWETLAGVVEAAIGDGTTALGQVRVEFLESLDQRCRAFEQRLTELDARAANSLATVAIAWEGLNWRSLQAAVKRDGEWYSRTTRREINLNRDIAHAYLDHLPFVWDDFFGNHLSALVGDVVTKTKSALEQTAAKLNGALAMLERQPAGVRDSWEISVRTAGESFQLQASEVRARLTTQIQHTRQSLSGDLVNAAASFMAPAYAQASDDPGGSGIKARMLRVLVSYAKNEAPGLFINMRQDLTDGVSVLQSSMKPQLSRIVAYGQAVLEQFNQNLGTYQDVSPEWRNRLQNAVGDLPSLPAEFGRDQRETRLH